MSYSEIKEKEKMYNSILKEIHHPEALPQNAKMPKGERASHLFLNFASSRNTDLLVHKPKRKSVSLTIDSTLGPGSYRESES